MKKVSVVGRLPLCATLVAGGLLMMAPGAHADQWQMSATLDGTSNAQDGGSYPRGAWNERQQGKVLANNGYGPMTFSAKGQSAGVVSGSTSVATSARAEGSITIYMKWVKGYDQRQTTPQPKMVVLRITGYATAYVNDSSGTLNAQFGKIAGTAGAVSDLLKSARANADTNPSSVITVPLSVPESGEVEYTFPLSAKAATPEKAYVSGSGEGYSEVLLDFRAERATIGVGISSSIETSWQKWTGAASALPDAYKVRDSYGNLTNTPNDKAVQVSGQDTSYADDDVWKIACLRGVDGKMSVESSPSWFHSRNPDFNGWLGSVKFTANQTGFYNPLFEWTDPADSFQSTTGSPQERDFTAQPPTFGTPFFGIKLGSQPGGSDLTKSSTVSVKITESNNSVSDSYTVKWHLPFEKDRDLWEQDNWRRGAVVAGPMRSPYTENFKDIKFGGGDFPAEAVFNGLSIVGGLVAGEAGSNAVDLAADLFQITEWKHHEEPKNFAVTSYSDAWSATIADENQFGNQEEIPNNSDFSNPPLLTGSFFDPPSLKDEKTTFPDGTHIWDYCELTIRVVEHRHMKAVTGDQYGQSGFMQANVINVGKKTTSVVFGQFFKQYRNTSGLPTTY